MIVDHRSSSSSCDCHRFGNGTRNENQCTYHVRTICSLQDAIDVGVENQGKWCRGWCFPHEVRSVSPDFLLTREGSHLGSTVGSRGIQHPHMSRRRRPLAWVIHQASFTSCTVCGLVGRCFRLRQHRIQLFVLRSHCW
eukprot:scaffold608_cov248-Pinguiococcus_pyrenoidosus.AAC.2